MGFPLLWNRPRLSVPRHLRPAFLVAYRAVALLKALVLSRQASPPRQAPWADQAVLELRLVRPSL